MDKRYPINLTEIEITYKDESTLECAALYNDHRMGGGTTLTAFL